MALPAISPRIAAGLVCVVLTWSLHTPCVAAQKPTPAQQVGPTAIHKALELGSHWLLNRIEAENFGRQGEGALMAYAAIQGGIEAQHPSLLSWADERSKYPATGTYEAASLLLALAAIDPQRYSSAIHYTASQLVQWQNSSGDWGYPSGADLSCTQFAALGLWRARQLGFPVPSKTWLKLAKRTQSYHNANNGGFSYSADSGSRISMTLAGVGIYALCEAELRAAGLWTNSARVAWAKSRERGLGYIEDRFGALEQSMTNWGYYSFYGMERTGAWLGVDMIGAHDWYQRGANLLVPMQRSEGSWDGSRVNTAFAVLFLARATSGTRQRLAFTAGSVKTVIPEIQSDQVCWLKSEGNGPEIKVSVDRWQWQAMRAYEHANERGQGARVQYVELLVDGKVHAVQLLDVSRPVGNRKLSFTFAAPQRGGYEIQLAFHVDVPVRAGDLETVVKSAPLQVVALRGLERLASAKSLEVFEPLANNLRQARATVSVSSRLHGSDGLPPGSHGGASMLDGSAETAWMPRVRDEKQRAMVRVPDGVMAHGLEFTAATRAPDGKELAHPRLIQVQVNGGETQVVLMPRDQLTVQLKFAQEIEIHELEVKIVTWAQPQGQERAPGGLAEVDLLAVD